MSGGPDEPLLAVEGLSVGFDALTDRRDVVRDVSFTLEAGRCLAIVGESGSGKSVTARSLVGLVGGRGEVDAERLTFDGRDLRGLRDRDWRRIRGRDIGFVLQDALVSLDPLRPIGREIEEALRLHGHRDRTARRARVLELLERAGIPDPAVRARQIPSELSGGLRQRALIASAVAHEPKLLIADEPTTALDVTVQAQILALLEEIRAQGTALLLISHDLGVVSRLADHVLIIQRGEIVERGAAEAVLRRPEHPYTRALLDAIPSAHPRGTRLTGTRPGDDVRRAPVAPADAVPVLEARGLVKRYAGPGGGVRAAVDDVSFTLGPGETLGIVGESGSGKTTTARLALALLEADEGSVLLSGEPWSGLPERARRERRRQISVIYQDPLGSFDPRWRVRRIIEDAVPGDERGSRQERVAELAVQVGLPPEVLDRVPLQLSGGQRQRVAIARALAPRPRVIVCDEPVSALDVLIQAQVLDLLGDLQRELGVSYLFISHDLGVIAHMSDRVMVMKDGRVVEEGTTAQVLGAPVHPYTRALLAALPAPPVREPVAA